MMKLGILDAVPPHYNEAVGKTDADCFRELFTAVNVSAEMPDYRVSQGHFPQNIAACDAYLITGSPCSVYDDQPWITELADFVRGCYSAGKPLVGICFGHQLIAQALGGSVKDAEPGWLLGLHELQISRTKAWMRPPQKKCALYFANHDQVVELPLGAERLAHNARCPNAMYTLGEQVLALQAHPEHPLSSLKIFTEALKPQLPLEIYQEAYASFAAGEPDAALFGRWIWQFLAQTG